MSWLLQELSMMEPDHAKKIIDFAHKKLARPLHLQPAQSEVSKGNESHRTL